MKDEITIYTGRVLNQRDLNLIYDIFLESFSVQSDPKNKERFSRYSLNDLNQNGGFIHRVQGNIVLEGYRNNGSYIFVGKNSTLHDQNEPRNKFKNKLENMFPSSNIQGKK